MNFTKIKNKRESKDGFLQIYKGLPKEIYYLFATKIINNLGRFISPILTLILTQKIGMSSVQAGWFITLSMIVQAPCMLIGGKLADSFGRKKIICIFFTLSAFTYLICAFLPMSVFLTCMMILASCFATVPGPAYDAYLTDYTNESNRQACFSLLYMGMNVGASIAPLIGGLLMAHHLRILFIGDAFTTLASVFILNIKIEDKIDFVKLQKENVKIAKEMQENVFKVLLRTPEILVFSIIMSIFAFTYDQWSFGLPLAMNAVFGENSAALYGSICSINGLMVIFTTPAIIFFTKKWKPTYVIALSGVLYAACFSVSAMSKNIYGFILAIVLLTLGEICTTINASTFIANMSKATHIGRISSVINIIRETGACISPTIVGFAIGAAGIKNALFLVAVVSMVGAVAISLLKYDASKVETELEV